MDDIKCSNCGSELHGGYCNCFIVKGEFRGTKTGRINKELITNMGEIEFEGKTYLIDKIEFIPDFYGKDCEEKVTLIDPENGEEKIMRYKKQSCT